jgi:hypothetical protein
MPPSAWFNAPLLLGDLTFLLALPEASRAASHQWCFNEFYSSSDAKVQFIEMREIAGSNFETSIIFHWFKTDTYNLDGNKIRGSNLTVGTAFKKSLVGSASHAALPGVSTPGYIIPDGAIDPSGDTVHWWIYQVIHISPNVLATDGVNSITGVDPLLPTDSVWVNSPTNYAGVTGTVVLPPDIPTMNSRGRLPLFLLTVLVAASALAKLMRARQPSSG